MTIGVNISKYPDYRWKKEKGEEEEKAKREEGGKRLKTHL